MAGPRNSGLRRIGGLTFLWLATLLLFLMRLGGPPDIRDRDQERPAAYVLDVTQNGHWLVQKDWTGDVASKPPVYTWLVALFSLATGSLTIPILYLPCFLATLGCVTIIYLLGSKYSGWAAGFLGGVLYLCSYLVTRQIAMARTDAVFSFTVAVAAVLGFRSWENGKGWLVFWIAAAVATLTKGPFGAALSMFGLTAIGWEGVSKHPHQLRGRWWLGVPIFVLIVGGWFLLSLNAFGPAVWETLVEKELVGLAISKQSADPIYIRFWKPSLYLLGRFLPGSILGVVGLAGVVKRSSPRPEIRRLERYLFMWFMLGLLALSFSTHQRGDHLMPILVPMAIFAGKILSTLIRGESHRMRAAILGGGLCIILLPIFGYYYYVVRPGKVPEIQQTIQLRQLAAMIESKGPDHPPLHHVDTPYTLQFYLNTMKMQISFERAAQLLKGREPVWVAVSDYGSLSKALKSDSPMLYEIARVPQKSKPYTLIVSNAPE